MFYRRPNWAQLIREGVPSLYVLRPLAGGFTPPNTGDEYPAPESTDKFQMARARQMYEQRRIGTWPELELALAKSGRRTMNAHGTPPKAGKEKKDGARSSQNRN